MTSPIHQCKECVDLLGDYIEGTLPADRSKALEDHLSRCPPCITFVRTYRATRKLCRHALSKDMPQELMHSLSSFLADHVPGFGCAKSDNAAAAEPSAADTAPKKA
ncbi:MAG: anti-sigma factor family protein [Myxococcales bacterium]